MNDETERWCPVVGWEGLYEVSDFGRMRSLDRTIMRSDGRSMTRRGAPLHPTPDSHGYPTMKLPDRRTYRVHVLVLEAFVGPCPPGMEGCHENDIGADNWLENLRWGTPSENQHDKVRNGHHNHATKTHCIRGHALVGVNLYIIRASGSRQCRACQAATGMRRRAERRGSTVSREDVQRYADRRYAEYMAEPSIGGASWETKR